MDLGSSSGFALLGIILVGFVLITILQQVIGRNFSWNKELD